MISGSPPTGGLGALSQSQLPEPLDTVSHTFCLSHSVVEGSDNVVPRSFGDEEHTNATSQNKQFASPAVSRSLSKRIHRSRDSRLARAQRRITLRRERRGLYRQWKRAIVSSSPHTSPSSQPPQSQAGRPRDTCMPTHTQSQYDLASTQQYYASAPLHQMMENQDARARQR